MNYFRPAEWSTPKTICLAWPFDKKLWDKNLIGAQNEFLMLLGALEQEAILVLLPNRKEEEIFNNKLAQKNNIKTLIMPYGDIWLRDTMPIWVKDPLGKNAVVIPKFNGWGQKYLFPDDLKLSNSLANYLGLPKIKTELVFEGGALEFNGQGTLLTTEQCLLNKNRNPGLSKKNIEKELNKLFNIEKVIWLKEGLKNDHTDGHVDTVARFIAPNKIAIMVPEDRKDPNYNALLDIKKILAREDFELIELPSPGEIRDENSAIMPTSYVNFIIGQNVVVMPTYDSRQDQMAISALQKSFDIPVKGLSAKEIITGGGAFHCISQEIFA